MRRTIFVAALVAAGAMFAGDAAAQTGAKALFLDPTSGSGVAPVNTASSNAKKPAAVRKPAEPTPLAVNAGLMYYIERQGPDDRVDRVNPTTIFHSGDKIRLQLKSNVAGRLVIAQRNADGTSGVLFPDGRVNGGDNRIQANMVAALPSWGAWFKFDNNPGEERLLVMLTPEGSNVQPGAVPTEPLRPWDDKRTQGVTLLAQAQRGSKALVIEVDESKDSAATYIVQPAGKVVSQGVITAEIVLVHR
ncbi:MAG: DUF4384 domain-containing protein [Acidobacteriia bacterium]|nr:DUF4384 domain-containing protein [Terriglobia bacterium]